MLPTNYCKDCKHLRRYWLEFWDTRLAKCARIFDVSLISGKKELKFCSSARIIEGDHCSYWEAKK